MVNGEKYFSFRCRYRVRSDYRVSCKTFG